MIKIKVAVVCFAIVFSAAALAWWCGEDPAKEMAMHESGMMHWRSPDGFVREAEACSEPGAMKPDIGWGWVICSRAGHFIPAPHPKHQAITIERQIEIADEFQSFDEPLGHPQGGDDGHQTHSGGDATRNCFVVLPKAAAQIVKTATVAIGDYPEKGDAFMGICEVIER